MMGASLRKAINDKCKQCSYDPLDAGTWRQQVDDCRVPECPLYEVRPRPYVPLAPSEKRPNRGNPGASLRHSGGAPC